MQAQLHDPYRDRQSAVEEVTRRTIRDLEDLARICPGARVGEIQHTISLLRSSLRECA